ncbi:MAG TPA: VTT domain-containing protein [Acidobacteriaceae bacterium]
MFFSVWLSAHGYLAVAVICFLSAVDLPAPATLSLLLAGAASAPGPLNATGRLDVMWVVATGAVAQMIGSLALFLGGRYTGWWLLARLCSVTLNAERCIFRSAEFFYKHGPKTLVIARFIPGLSSIASPLAGSLHMRLRRFLTLDATGALIFVAANAYIGRLLHGAIGRVVATVMLLGNMMTALVLLLITGYMTLLVAAAIRNRKYSSVERITAVALQERLANPDLERPVVIADVRSHGYYDPKAVRIQSSIRIEPSRLPVELDALRETLAVECDVYVYCSCAKEATSARIAHMMMERGNRVAVIAGGMRSWIRAGCPTEPVPEHDVEHLPRFR